MPTVTLSSSLTLFPLSSSSTPPRIQCRSTTLTFPSFLVKPTSVGMMGRGSHILPPKAVVIEKETPENERPSTFLRESDGDNYSPSSVRGRFEKMIRDAQDCVCQAIEAADGGGKFKEDVWSRPGGGGGISRVLQDGAVWEKAGVNVSVVYGVMPPEAYRAAKPASGTDSSDLNHKPGPVPFFAAGISSVLHPKNPFAPTLHFNYRYFETDAPKDAPGAPRQWWFGGGTDLTPAYIFEEDVKHFHSVQKSACDKFDPSFYPRFKKWCDDYFYIKFIRQMCDGIVVYNCAEILGAAGEAVADLKQLFSLAEKFGYSEWIQFDASVVRGLAYYTGIVFEGFDREGKLRAICGGGRYDHLLSTFGGDDIPACGFGFGDAVIIELLKEKGLLPELSLQVENIVCALDHYLQGAAAAVATRLREKGQSVDLVLESKPLKWVFKRAMRTNAQRLILVGNSEWQRGMVGVKILSSGEQYEIKLDELE